MFDLEKCDGDVFYFVRQPGKCSPLSLISDQAIRSTQQRLGSVGAQLNISVLVTETSTSAVFIEFVNLTC